MARAPGLGVAGDSHKYGGQQATGAALWTTQPAEGQQPSQQASQNPCNAQTLRQAGRKPKSSYHNIAHNKHSPRAVALGADVEVGLAGEDHLQNLQAHQGVMGLIVKQQ